MLTFKISCLMFCIMLQQDSAGAQDVQTLAVKLKSSQKTRQGKLSPELEAVKLSGGVLVANTSDGRLVIKGVAKEDLPRLIGSGDLDGIETSIPAKQSPIKKLRVSYSPGNKPSAYELNQMGLRLVEDYKKGSFLIVEPMKSIDTPLLNSLVTSNKVTYVRPVMQLQVIKPQRGKKPNLIQNRSRLSSLPDDPRLSDLWGMENINAERAWNTVTSGDVIVAVIDTGVDYTHEDLQSNMWRNPDEIEGDGIDNDGNGLVDDVYGADFVHNDGDPMDDNAHGTHCAGTVAGTGDNSVGVVGVTWKTPIMALKWITASGGGSSVDAIKCIDYAVDKGAKILSNSWWHPEDPELKEAIERARDAGVIFVVAAGNEDLDNDDESNAFRYPSSYDVENIISVAAINESEGKAWFSSYGATSVDLAAPGVDVLSTIPNDGYDEFNGTSMACPHVAGAAALIWSAPATQNAHWTDVKNMILDNARSIPSMAGRCLTEGTLDISFIEDSGGNGKCGPQIVSASFLPGDVMISPDTYEIAKLEINLQCDSMVTLSGNTSVNSDETTVDFRLTGSSGEWSEALRFVDLPANRWQIVSVQHTTFLPAGSHQLSWHGFADQEVSFDGGSLTATIIPATDGGSSVVAGGRNVAGVQSMRGARRAQNQPRFYANQRAGNRNRKSQPARAAVQQSDTPERFSIHIEVNPIFGADPSDFSSASGNRMQPESMTTTARNR